MSTSSKNLPEMLDAAQLREKLYAPLPDEAMESFGTFVTIKPQYEIERMNDVFGIGGWSKDVKVLTNEKAGGYDKDGKAWWEATAICVIRVPRYKIKLTQYGGHQSPDRGNAMKGACTDAFGKCCSEIGIGDQVYKGLMTPYDLPRDRNLFLCSIMDGWSLHEQGLTKEQAAEWAHKEWREQTQTLQRPKSVKKVEAEEPQEVSQ